MAETRIELFAQATDTRPEELKSQGVRPRVWFGERWITSIFDLFEENVRYFPTLLPEISEEDPAAELAAGRTPRLSGAAPAQRHRLPVEPAGIRRRQGPSARPGREPGATGRADGGRHDGQCGVLLRAAAHHLRGGPTPWTKMSFAAAHDNFVGPPAGEWAPPCTGGHRQVTPTNWCCGICCRWPTRPAPLEGGRRRAGPLPRRHHRGRAKTGRNGAVWQVATVDRLEARGLDRPKALGRNAAQLLRSHAQQRAGAHLGLVGQSDPAR